MKQKIVGVSPRITTISDTKKLFVNQNYIERLSERDLTPLLILSEQNIETLLDMCDAFLITGGGDLNPNLYNETNDLNLSDITDPFIDRIDKIIIDYAVKTKKPLLGICRGHQSINVFLGGSLYQDIPNHKSISSNHHLKTIKNNMLDFNEEIYVNSYHHQAVKVLAEGLIEIAYFEENHINEAFIHESLPIISVQWHPERLENSKESKLIFDKFKELIK